jgi:DNA primase
MTGQIPNAFIAELLARTDIVEVIGARIHLRRAGANFVARCPFHHEKTPSFTVSTTRQFYHCFGCGVSGDAIRFLTEYEGLHFVEAVEVLASRAGLRVPVEEGDEAKAKNTVVAAAPVYAMLSEAALLYQKQLRQHSLARKAQEYLKSRGVTGEIAKLFSLGFAPPTWDLLVKDLGTSQDRLQALFSAGLIVKKETGTFYDRFRDRILFPIRDRRGRVIGFGGRIIGCVGEPKYLNSPETMVFNKGAELYGLYEARLGNPTLIELLVVEGYMDVVSLAQFGIKNVVATLGTALTEKQVALLFKQVHDLIFCFDGDKAGREAAKRALPIILPYVKEGKRVRFLLLPDGEDPDSFVCKNGQSAFLERAHRAMPLSDFLFETLTENLDLNYLDNRAQLITVAKPLIKRLPTGVLQQMLYERLAELSGVEAAVIQDRPPVYKKKMASDLKKNLRRPHALPPSPAYRAVAMLLKNRTLITHLPLQHDFKLSDIPGADLLCELIEILKIETTISLEVLEERLFQEKESQLSFKALQAIADPIPVAGIEQEFLGAIQRLQARSQEQAMESLLIKAKTGALSKDEKAHLKNLLDLKGKNWVD